MEFQSCACLFWCFWQRLHTRIFFLLLLIILAITLTLLILKLHSYDMCNMIISSSSRQFLITILFGFLYTAEMWPKSTLFLFSIYIFSVKNLFFSLFSILSIKESWKCFIDSNSNTLLRMLYPAAGQERFRTLTSSYYRGAQGIIMGILFSFCHVHNELLLQE